MKIMKVHSISKRFATRESGAAARELVLRQLSMVEGPVTLDFDGIEQEPTPSFADEFVGRLAEELGTECFHKRVRLVNLKDPVRLLLQNVVAKRLRSGSERGRSSLCVSP